MKHFILLSVLCLFVSIACGQGLINYGANITITSGATVSIDGTEGNFLNQDNGSSYIGKLGLYGTMDLKGD